MINNSINPNTHNRLVAGSILIYTKIDILWINDKIRVSVDLVC